jgi:hypothetical protein
MAMEQKIKTKKVGIDLLPDGPDRRLELLPDGPDRRLELLTDGHIDISDGAVGVKFKLISFTKDSKEIRIKLFCWKHSFQQLIMQ